MKHYHGTPIGGKRVHADEFCEGRLVLIPWKRPEDLQRALDYSQGFIVDNSAFSFWSTGEKPSWSEYVTWVMNFANNPRFDFALIPDVIDGTESENDYLIDWWGRVAKRIASCPVWHLHESIHRLQRLAMNFERVAFGSSGEFATPGTDSWRVRMNEAVESICDLNGYPVTKIHGLRMLRRDIVERYPFASADSTDAVQNGSLTAVQIGTDAGWARQTRARRIEKRQSPSVFIPAIENQFELFNF